MMTKCLSHVSPRSRTHAGKGGRRAAARNLVKREQEHRVVTSPIAQRRGDALRTLDELVDQR